MSGLVRASAAGLVAGAALILAAPAAVAAPAGGPAPVVVTVDRASAAVGLGDRLTMRSTVLSAGAATGPLIAHLDVVSLHDSVYVDPEDWSSDRSVAVQPLEPGGRGTLDWSLQAVNAGEFDVYVVVLPAAGGPAAPLAVSAPLRLTVASRRTLNPGGSVAVVLAVPLLVGALGWGGRLRWRRRRDGTALPGTAADRPARR